MGQVERKEQSTMHSCPSLDLSQTSQYIINRFQVEEEKEIP